MTPPPPTPPFQIPSYPSHTHHISYFMSDWPQSKAVWNTMNIFLLWQVDKSCRLMVFKFCQHIFALSSAYGHLEICCWMFNKSVKNSNEERVSGGTCPPEATVGFADDKATGELISQTQTLNLIEKRIISSIWFHRQLYTSSYLQILFGHDMGPVPCYIFRKCL